MQYNAVCMHMYTTVIKKLAGLRGWGWSPTSSSSLAWRVSKGRPCRRGGHERFLHANDASSRVFEQSESPHGRHAGGATLSLDPIKLNQQPLFGINNSSAVLSRSGSL